jgi:hypothetical protein
MSSVQPRRETVSYFILADDGLLYRNPVVAGDNWALSFDFEEGGPILEISTRFIPPRCPDPLAAARKILRGFVPVVADLDPKRQARVDGRQRPPVWIFPVVVSAPLPSKYMRQYAGRRQPYGRPYIIEDFGQPWG